jgi:predicted DNA-binding protein
MMNATIHIPSKLYKRLSLKSRQLERTPAEVVADLVEHYLAENDDSWQAQFGALLLRVHARTAAFSSEEIEADITLAARKARELRGARRPA